MKVSMFDFNAAIIDCISSMAFPFLLCIFHDFLLFKTMEILFLIFLCCYWTPILVDSWSVFYFWCVVVVDFDLLLMLLLIYFNILSIFFKHCKILFNRSSKGICTSSEFCYLDFDAKIMFMRDSRDPPFWNPNSTNLWCLFLSHFWLTSSWINLVKVGLGSSCFENLLTFSILFCFHALTILSSVFHWRRL